MGRKINIRPETDVYSTYKRLSYQHWSALAEFVDNSTQSFYDHQEELLATKYYKNLSIDIDYVEDPINGDYITIRDDAYGMEWSDFVRAINLHRPPQNTSGRNEFGMGLKTAACWYGTWWSVESTRLGSTKKYRAVIDVDILEKYKSEEIDVEEETVSPKEHYTLITIKRLNQRITGARTKGKIKDLLSSTYREDIRTGLIDITFRGDHLQFKEVTPYEETRNGVTTTWKKDIEFSVKHDNNDLTVKGFIAIRLPGSLKDAGFTLIRRGRVIIGGSEKNYRPYEIFGDTNSFVYQRLYGELHMDNWPVTQAKDAFDWNNSGLEEQFIEQLKVFTEDYKQKCSNIRVREQIQTEDIIKQVADSFKSPGIFENVSYQIDEQIEIEPPTNNVEIVTPVDNTTEVNETETKTVINDEDNSVELQGGTNIVFNFEYKNTPYSFTIDLDSKNPAAYWISVSEKDTNEYTVKINTRHAFFIPFIQKREFIPLITKLAIAMVLSEGEAKKISPDGRIDAEDIRLNMNRILEEIARRNISND